MPSTRSITFAVATCLAAMAQPALASDNSDSGMQVSARMPVLCAISSATAMASEDDAIARSTIFESCNTNRGFQIVAFHRPLADGEQANVTYDGQRTNLERTGFSMVQFRQGARHGPVDVEVATQQLRAPLAISFAMTPV
ncbi:MAG: hypothetical protein WA985_02530 [Erythrobacter sp.]